MRVNSRPGREPAQPPKKKARPNPPIPEEALDRMNAEIKGFQDFLEEHATMERENVDALGRALDSYQEDTGRTFTPMTQLDSGWWKARRRFEAFWPVLRNRVEKREVPATLCEGFVFGLLYRLGDPEEEKMVAQLWTPGVKGITYTKSMDNSMRITTAIWVRGVVNGEARRPEHPFEAAARDILVLSFDQWSRGKFGAPQWAEFGIMLKDFGAWDEATVPGRDLRDFLQKTAHNAAGREDAVRGASDYLMYFADGKARQFPPSSGKIAPNR